MANALLSYTLFCGTNLAGRSWCGDGQHVPHLLPMDLDQLLITQNFNPIPCQVGYQTPGSGSKSAWGSSQYGAAYIPGWGYVQHERNEVHSQMRG